LALIGDIRQMTDIPIGLLVYYNTVLAQGVASFYQQVARLGVDGVLVADLPPEAAEPEVVPLARGHGVAPLFLISPMTSGERLRRIGTVADGFLYAVSRLGITGTHDVYDDTLAQLIGRAHAETTLPVCVGFGISTPAQAKKMVALGADGVITGSGVIQAVRHRGDVPIDEAVRRYCADFMVAP
jgi:tryptophan synthase alpha chain